MRENSQSRILDYIHSYKSSFENQFRILRSILDFHRYNHGTFHPLEQSKIFQRLFDGDLIASVHLIVPLLFAISYPIVSVVLPTRRLAPTMKPSSPEEHENRFAGEMPGWHLSQQSISD